MLISSARFVESDRKGRTAVSCTTALECLRLVDMSQCDVVVSVAKFYDVCAFNAADESVIKDVMTGEVAIFHGSVSDIDDRLQAIGLLVHRFLQLLVELVVKEPVIGIWHGNDPSLVFNLNDIVLQAVGVDLSQHVYIQRQPRLLMDFML